jgi:hypothetical protein
MDVNGFESDVVTTPVCVPESSSVTCSGKCGTQTNNCGTSVNCGVCESGGEVFEGEVIYVTSPGNGNSINSNFNSALSQAQNGDVIVLPAGNFIVTSQLSVNKFVSIIGHGSGSGGTMLQKQVGSSFSYVIRYDDNYNPGPNEFLVISGIYVRGYDVSRTDVGLFIQQDNFVVTNSKFEEFGFAGIYVKHDEDEPHGVIYNNEFIHNCRNDLGYGVSVIGRDTEWIDDPGFGTDKFIFIEDNYFSEHRHSVASSGTGKYVARYNTIIDNICQGAHSIDMHEARCASLGSGNHFAARAAEIYGNNITNYRVRDIHGGVPIVPNGNIEQLSFSGVGIRGGEAVIWDNYIEGFVYGVRLYIQPSSGECGTPYPMLTQIGYQSALDYGSSHTGTDASHAAGDVFSWSNTFKNYDSTDRSFSDWNSRGTSSTYPDSMLDANRDYHLVAKPGYTPYTYPHPLRVSVEQKISNLNL